MMPNADSAGVRLNKWISEHGVCSRREADRLIEQGLVEVNGKPAGLGVRVTVADRVTVRGRTLVTRPPSVYLAYHKPPGITCTTDRSVPENIVDAVAFRERIFPVGRLDKFSEGLILLTNDGEIVNKILRAGNAHEKEYIVSVDRPLTTEFLDAMAAGVPILDTVTKPCRVRQLSARTFSIVLIQGLNRQIRRMTEQLGFRVARLRRVRIMHIHLDDLAMGRWRFLTGEETKALNRMLETSTQAPAFTGDEA